MPSMSADLSPASAIALSAASACNWICDMSGMTPSRVVSAAPTMAIVFGVMAVNLSRLIEAVIASDAKQSGARGDPIPSRLLRRLRLLAMTGIVRIGSAPRRAEEGEGHLVVELLEGGLDPHLELQSRGGLRAP